MKGGAAVTIQSGDKVDRGDRLAEDFVKRHGLERRQTHRLRADTNGLAFGIRILYLHGRGPLMLSGSQAGWWLKMKKRPVTSRALLRLGDLPFCFSLLLPRCDGCAQFRGDLRNRDLVVADELAGGKPHRDFQQISNSDGREVTSGCGSIRGTFSEPVDDNLAPHRGRDGDGAIGVVGHRHLLLLTRIIRASRVLPRLAIDCNTRVI
jgi:hypothetical protein